MTKVFMIGNEDPIAFQNSINDFIRNKKIIDIKYQAFLLPKEYTGGVMSRSVVVDRALIIYEDGPSLDDCEALSRELQKFKSYYEIMKGENG